MRDALRRRLAPVGVPAYRAVFLAHVISELGDWAARLALAVLVFQRTKSPELTALVTAVSLLPWVGPGQVLAAASSRWPRRRVMVTADLVRAAVFGVLLVPMPVAGILPLVLVAGLATPPFMATRSAVLPEILDAELYPDALSLSGSVMEVTAAVGYLVSGVMVAALGARSALALDAGSFLVSAALLMRLRTGPATPSGRSLRADLGRARRLLVRSPLLRRAVTLPIAASFTATGIDALVAPYSLGELHDGARATGVLAAGMLLIPVLVTAGLPTKGTPGRLLGMSALLCAVAGGVAGVGFALDPRSLTGALVPFCMSGALISVIVPANVVVGPRLPTEIRPACFSLLMGSLVGGQVGGATIAGALAGWVGVASAAALICLPSVCYGLYALARPARDEIVDPLVERPAAAHAKAQQRA